MSYFYQKGTDTQPLSVTGNIPWVDRDFNWRQHNFNLASTWTLADDDQPVRGHLRAPVRRPPQQPDTSLGDLDSKFTIQGAPTLPRFTVSGYFTGRPRSPAPTPGSNYFG